MSAPADIQVQAAESVLAAAGVVIGGTVDSSHRRTLARQLVEAVRAAGTGDWEIRYRRFRDPVGTHGVWAAGRRDEIIIDFIDCVMSGPFNSVGDMSTQDAEKGYAEVWLWWGGRSD